MKKFSLLVALITITLISIAVIGVNATSSNEKELDAIKNVLINASTIADKAYVDCKTSDKQGILNSNKENIMKKHHDNLNDVFDNKYVEKIKKAWIDDQVTNVQDGPDCVEAGISNIEIKDFSINGNTATVTAILTKYLIDRVNQNGKYYLDKMEGNITDTATLTKENGKWKIVQFESIPDLDSTTHTLTAEK
ncbi:MAG: hypothetical protein CVV03_05830 [Firmicutes bacterium HGW-Firmicutes-8]|nr:MAG: hypothetical protein CVV03_05830 [Firmicutes bacterium HGW-Firmicutes-8]